MISYHIFIITNKGLIMPITTEIDNDKQLTSHTAIGDVPFEELMTAIKQAWEGPQTMNIVWDFSKGTVDLSSEQIKAISNHIKHHSEKRREGKTAIIVSRDLGYGMARMGGTLVEMKGATYKINTFRSYEEAMHNAVSLRFYLQ